MCSLQQKAITPRRR